jgi:hypothetical protein
VSEPFVDPARPENAGVLAYLERRNTRGRPLVEHPDAVEQPWLFGAFDARDPAWVAAAAARASS